MFFSDAQIRPNKCVNDVEGRGAAVKPGFETDQPFREPGEPTRWRGDAETIGEGSFCETVLSRFFEGVFERRKLWRGREDCELAVDAVSGVSAGYWDAAADFFVML